MVKAYHLTRDRTARYFGSITILMIVSGSGCPKSFEGFEGYSVSSFSNKWVGILTCRDPSSGTQTA